MTTTARFNEKTFSVASFKAELAAIRAAAYNGSGDTPSEVVALVERAEDKLAVRLHFAAVELAEMARFVLSNNLGAL